jgi:hypothetical protein
MINNPTSQTSSAETSTFDKCTNSEITVGANAPVTILKANPKRAYAALINNSAFDITLILGSNKDGAINKGIILKPRGGSFEITAVNLYIGQVTAICASETNITFVECVK